MSTFKVEYLSVYWSCQYGTEEVPEDRWRTAVEHFTSQQAAFLYATRKAHDTGQVYRVCEVICRPAIIIDPNGEVTE